MLRRSPLQSKLQTAFLKSETTSTQQRLCPNSQNERAELIISCFLLHRAETAESGVIGTSILWNEGNVKSDTPSWIEVNNPRSLTDPEVIVQYLPRARQFRPVENGPGSVRDSFTSNCPITHTTFTAGELSMHIRKSALTTDLLKHAL